jgi:CHRD domain
MRRFAIGSLLLAVFTVASTLTAADTDDTSGPRHFVAKLNGFQEVPPIFTNGEAKFEPTLNEDKTIDFRLTWENLTAAPTVAHIHFGPRGVNGSPFIFFCGGGGKPDCPANTSGSLEGTITAHDVIAVPTQGIKAGDIDAAIRILLRGAAYANMHTPNFPSGEIRGQIKLRFQFTITSE